MSGYIKYWRSATQCPDYFAEPFTKWQAWMDMLILANYKEGTIFVRGIPVDIKPGQLPGGEEYLADRWKWSRGKVRRFMAYLSSETVQRIVQQKSKVVTVITILNWDKYQGNGTTDDTIIEPTDGTTNGQQTDIPKKGKKGKKGNKSNKLFPEDSDELRLANHLAGWIKRNNPKAKIPTDLQGWAKQIDLMIRLDNREVAEIERVIDWCQKDPFWMANILSVPTLRKKFDQLIMRMGTNGNRLQNGGDHGISSPLNGKSKPKAGAPGYVYHDPDTGEPVTYGE